jgi:phosphatidylinositol glycan class T
MELELPANSSFIFSYKFDKGSLKYTEYPPDPNRGFDIRYFDCVIFIIDLTYPIHSGAYLTYWADRIGLGQSIDWYKSPEEPKLLKTKYQISSNTMLLVLPLPDFSMPYNVITFTCTIFALFFGSLFNLYTRRFVTKEEYAEKSMVGRIKIKLGAIVSKIRSKLKRD